MEDKIFPSNDIGPSSIFSSISKYSDMPLNAQSRISPWKSELDLCQKYPGSGYQCRHLQHYEDGTLEQSETICIPDICIGSAESDGIFPEAGEGRLL